jgi:formate--tetrahydrofolate ligase
VALPSDLEIARGATLTPLVDVAGARGLGSHLLEPYGKHVVKVKPTAIDELVQAPIAKYVVVTAGSVNPAVTRIDIDARGEIVGLS